MSAWTPGDEDREPDQPDRPDRRARRAPGPFASGAEAAASRFRRIDPTDAGRPARPLRSDRDDPTAGAAGVDDADLDAPDVDDPDFDGTDFDRPGVRGADGRGRRVARDPREEEPEATLPRLEFPARPVPVAAPAPRGAGAMLRMARIDRGISIAEVERDTRINRRYLEAIEAEQFDHLPAPVYVRGFVRSYARYLGIDDDAAVAAIPGDLPRPPGLDPLPGLRAQDVSALPQVDARWLAFGGAALAALVVLFALWSWVFGGGGGDGADGGGPLDAPATVTADGATGATGGAPGATGDGATGDGATGDGATGDGATGDGAADDGDTGSPAPPPAAAVPPFEVGETPEFVGVSLEAASAVLAQLELQFVVIEAQHPTFAPGTVFAQTPEPGSDIGAEDVVTLIVARGDDQP